jgi:hypothetical protein
VSTELWIKEIETGDGKTIIEHLDGVPWHQMDPPRRAHQCWTQTRGWINYFTSIQRCPCGGLRYDGSHWMDRNTRAVEEAEIESSDNRPWWAFWRRSA